MVEIWAIHQNPLCYIKQNATNRKYRTDWCENCVDGRAHCGACSIGKAYKAGDIEVRPGQLLPPSREYYSRHGGMCSLRPIESRADVVNPEFVYSAAKHEWCNGMADCNQCSVAKKHREAEK